MSEITKGRIVHFVAAVNPPLEQAAIIVHAWKGSLDLVNLVIFRDGSNDHDGEMHISELTAWRTSVERSSDDQTKLCSWHFAHECKGGGQ